MVRVHEAPPLDVMAIDNLPSLLPVESSQDFAAQLLPHLATLDTPGSGVWARARAEGLRHSALVSVQGSQGYWQRQGYAAQAVPDAHQRQHLASYGAGAVYMARTLAAA